MSGPLADYLAREALISRSGEGFTLWSFPAGVRDDFRLECSQDSGGSWSVVAVPLASPATPCWTRLIEVQDVPDRGTRESLMLELLRKLIPNPGIVLIQGGILLSNGTYFARIDGHWCQFPGAGVLRSPFRRLRRVVFARWPNQDAVGSG